MIPSILPLLAKGAAGGAGVPGAAGAAGAAGGAPAAAGSGKKGGDIGRGAMGFMGSVLSQSPLTRGLMSAGQAGLMAARDPSLDMGEAFLNVGNTFGAPGAKKKPSTSPPTPPPLPTLDMQFGTGAAPGMQFGTGAVPPVSFGATRPRHSLLDEDLELMLSDNAGPFNPFGR